MIYYVQKTIEELDSLLTKISCDGLFLLMDENTERLCFPLVANTALKNAVPIVIGASDANKGIESLCKIWQALINGGASRHSLLVNLGGGMITDIGGFAAATFKRGIRFVNIPTTLLSMVDAAVGGKTGINFSGLKNEIGAFRNSEAVVIDTSFLHTLDDENLRSGYAEMLKHALLSSEEMWYDHINFSLEHPNLGALQQMVEQSIAVKSSIVERDPHEHSLRKALNLGHTFGHAFESLALQRGRPILHGYAVAFGLCCELYLACLLTDFPEEKMQETLRFVHQYYGTFPLSDKDYPALLQFMRHDKKNTAGHINFTLLSDVGCPSLDNQATERQIIQALNQV